LTGRNIGIFLIAGPVELYSAGSPVGKYSYCDPLPDLNFRGDIYKCILKKFDVIAVTGTFTKNYLKSIGIDENKIFIPPKTISDEFNNQDREKEYDVIYVGRLAKVKHVETLIKATKLLKSQYPNIQVGIVGDGECKPSLENLTNKLELNKNIHFVGYQENVWDWYNKAKVSVVSSEREGLPRVAIESLKCGVPVITSNCGDVKDIIKNGYNGFIIEDYDDFRGFARKIITILDGDKSLNEYSENSIESVKNINLDQASSVWEEAFSILS